MMVEILWHRRETRRQRRTQTSTCTSGGTCLLDPPRFPQQRPLEELIRYAASASQRGNAEQEQERPRSACRYQCRRH
jgi:hypothetical protein